MFNRKPTIEQLELRVQELELELKNRVPEPEPIAEPVDPIIEMLEADLHNHKQGRLSGWETLSRVSAYKENSYDHALTVNWERLQERAKARQKKNI